MVSYSLSRDSLSSLDVCNHSGGSAQDTAQLQSSVLKALQDGHCKRILLQTAVQKLKACAEILG